MQGNTCRLGALFTNRTRRKTWAKWPKINQLYRKSNPRNTVSPGSCSFAKPFTRKGNKCNSTSEILTQSSASTLVHSTTALQKSAAPLPSARLIERDTQDLVHFGARGAIDQDLGRAYQKCPVGRKKPI